VLNVDRDASALSISQELCERLGYAGRMSFACEDITQESGSDWGRYEVVFLAALVGTDTRAKLAILESLARKLAPGTLVVARSARGMRSVLYPVRQEEKRRERFC
jgi:nicotianamine synthase